MENGRSFMIKGYRKGSIDERIIYELYFWKSREGKVDGGIYIRFEVR